METYIYAFLFCGFVCMLSQIILDNTKLTPGHVTSLFVIIGAFLDIFGHLMNFAVNVIGFPITAFWNFIFGLVG